MYLDTEFEKQKPLSSESLRRDESLRSQALESMMEPLTL